MAQRARRRETVLAVIVGIAVVSLLVFATAPTDEGFRGDDHWSFENFARDAAASEPALPEWISVALCHETCAELLTMGQLTQTLVTLEAPIGSAPEQQQRLESLGWSICPDTCPDRFLTRSQVELILWRWLGSPGWPLIGTGPITSDEAMARSYFAHVIPGSSLACQDTCEARLRDVKNAIAELQLRGQLKGLSPRSPAPSDLVGVAPFWSATSWHPAGYLCNDLSGRARYGYYTGGRVCVSPELDPDLRRDVARHELAHHWQVWSGTSITDVEAEADCWAALHGASWFSYVPDGCSDAGQRQELLDAYAVSLGLEP